MLRPCAILLRVLALAPTTVYARGGGGGGGGFHGGGGTHGGGFHSGFHGPVGGFHSGNLRRPGVRQANRFNNHRRFARNGFNNGVGFVWGGLGDWWPDYQGYGVQPVQPAQAPVQPEVIVIHADPDGRMTTAESAPADYSYVQGCKPIPNGYHCDAH